MNTISAKTVEKTWQETVARSPSEAPNLINKFSEQQPLVVAYLVAAGHDIFNQDEKEHLLYMGINVWKMMSQGEKPLPKVTQKTLDQVENNNFKMLEYLDGESEIGFSETAKQIISNYNQLEILRYVVEVLFGDEEDDDEIREKMKGQIMLHLKTVIDCFDR